MCVFVWRPIFTGRALLPGDYLAQMSPWSSVQSSKLKVQSQDSQHPEPVEGSGNPGPQWNPLQWDAIVQFYPWRVFYARSMASGHIPLWNPHQFCGTPFLANGQSACLYPFNLLFLILNPITAFTVFAALHLFLAQVFMYWLMRELGAKELGGIVAAIVFAFSAFMVLWLELPTFVSVAVWLPLALMLVQRAVTRRSAFYGMLSGAVIGLTFLAGHFQIAFYVALATGLWWLWKTVEVLRAEGKIYSFLKVGVPLMGCVVIAGLIAAPQLLPTQELAANSHRVRAVTEEGYQAFLDNAVPAYRLVTAFAPGFFGNPSENSYYLLGRVGDSRHVGSAADYMEYGMYAGILPLMLAFIALGSIRKKHVGFFALLAVLALLTATGTPINRLFYFGIPGFSALGGPNRILLLYLFGVAALAGFGADRFAEHACDRVRIGRRERPVGLVWGLLALHLVILFSLTSRLVATRFVMGLQMEPIRTLLLPVLVILSDVVLLIRSFNVVSRSVFSVVVVAVIVADLFTFGISYNPTCARSEVYPKTALTTELKRLTKNGERIAPINPKWSLFQTPEDAILPPNAAMVYGLYDVQGYDSLYTRAYKDWSSKIQGEDSSPPENGNMVLVRQVPDKAELSALARYVVARNVASVDGLTVTALPNASPAERYLSPNRVIAPFMDGPVYPGWVMIDKAGTRYERYWELGLAPPPIEPSAQYVFEPFTFRLGLFLMLVGVGALTCVGVYRAKRYRIAAKR